MSSLEAEHEEGGWDKFWGLQELLCHGISWLMREQDSSLVAGVRWREEEEQYSI